MMVFVQELMHRGNCKYPPCSGFLPYSNLKILDSTFLLMPLWKKLINYVVGWQSLSFLAGLWQYLGGNMVLLVQFSSFLGIFFCQNPFSAILKLKKFKKRVRWPQSFVVGPLKQRTFFAASLKWYEKKNCTILIIDEIYFTFWPHIKIFLFFYSWKVWEL